MTSPGGTLTERLQLVVDATTGAAETKFQRLTGAARETGQEATRSADSVRDAADRVAAARDRELTAAGNVRVAETRLQALRDGGRARADQLAAAEERVAGAQRTLHLATQNTARATQDQVRVQQDATTETNRAEQSTSRLSGTMDDLRSRAVTTAATLGAAGLLGVLRGIGEGFAGSARDAGMLATSMNATVGEAGAFLGLVGSLGLELDDLLEIQAEFAQKVQDNGSALQKLGVQTERNANGTVNWTDTLVSFLAELQGVEDATERNRLGFMFLGEEGFKQLSRLVNSGVDVRDALEKIGSPFTERDVEMAAEYDAAMLDLSLTSTRTQQQLGRVLLPVITGLAEGVGDLVDVVEEVPVPLALATAAALTLGLTGWNPAAAAGGRLSVAMAAVNSQLAVFRFTAATAGIGAATLTAGMAGATAAGSRLSGVLGGPLGIALIATAGLYVAMKGGQDAFRDSAREAAVQLGENDRAIRSTDGAVKDAARALVENAGYWERAAMAQRGYSDALRENGLPEWLADATAKGAQFFPGLNAGLADSELAARGAAEGIEDAADELGEFGLQQETVQTTTKELNDLIAEGTTTGAEFAEAVRAAAEAEAEQTRTTDLAKAALDAYNATTRDSVQTQLDLISAQLQQADTFIGFMQTVHEARDVVDDLSTPWNEVEEATLRTAAAALNYAGTASDAAVSAARANGVVVDSLEEGRIRAETTIVALRESLSAPGLTDSARTQIESMIGKLEEAQTAGDVEAILRLTGVSETEGELRDATRDRDSIVRVESRNGPAVKRYLDGLADQRLALIRVESRNGPAVRSYLGELEGEDRLALIRVESRNGPAVDDYLDGLASQSRTAYIDVRQRGAAAVRDAVGAMRGAPAARATAGAYGAGDTIVERMTVVVQADERGQLTQPSLAEAGRQVARQLGAHASRSGPVHDWRRSRGGTV